jgi:hypothetical protein
MRMFLPTLPNWLRQHWFYAAAAMILMGDFTVITLDKWQNARLMEAGLLADFAIVIPLLYLICYRKNGSKALIRALGLCCLGIWAVGHIVPEAQHHMIEKVSFLRYVGLGVLLLIELRLMIGIYRAMFGKPEQMRANIESSLEKANLPPWLARIVMLEAKLWRKLWQLSQRVIQWLTGKKP